MKVAVFADNVWALPLKVIELPQPVAAPLLKVREWLLSVPALPLKVMVPRLAHPIPPPLPTAPLVRALQLKVMDFLDIVYEFLLKVIVVASSVPPFPPVLPQLLLKVSEPRFLVAPHRLTITVFRLAVIVPALTVTELIFRVPVLPLIVIECILAVPVSILVVRVPSLALVLQPQPALAAAPAEPMSQLRTALALARSNVVPSRVMPMVLALLEFVVIFITRCALPIAIAPLLLS